MKPDSEKLKSRNCVTSNDADWQKIKDAARLCGQPLSYYMRETLVTQAEAVIALKKINGKRGGR